MRRSKNAKRDESPAAAAEAATSDSTTRDRSLFGRAAVMYGYPLDAEEKAAVKRALDRIEQSRKDGPRPSTHE